MAVDKIILSFLFLSFDRVNPHTSHFLNAIDSSTHIFFFSFKFKVHRIFPGKNIFRLATHDLMHEMEYQLTETWFGYARRNRNRRKKNSFHIVFFICIHFPFNLCKNASVFDPCSRYIYLLLLLCAMVSAEPLVRQRNANKWTEQQQQKKNNRFKNVTAP